MCLCVNTEKCQEGDEIQIRKRRKRIKCYASC